MENGLIHSLDLIIDEETYSTTASATRTATDRINNIHVLFDATDLLLKVHRKASRAVSEESVGLASQTAYREARRADKERVKDILVAGKRVFENDIDTVEQQAKAKQLLGGNDEAAAQATAVFGTDSVMGTDKALKYMQKGMKKMTKGLDSEM